MSQPLGFSAAVVAASATRFIERPVAAAAAVAGPWAAESGGRARRLILSARLAIVAKPITGGRDPKREMDAIPGERAQLLKRNQVRIQQPSPSDRSRTGASAQQQFSAGAARQADQPFRGSAHHGTARAGGGISRAAFS